jgi:hypothetical protein
LKPAEPRQAPRTASASSWNSCWSSYSVAFRVSRTAFMNETMTRGTRFACRRAETRAPALAFGRRLCSSWSNSRSSCRRHRARSSGVTDGCVDLGSLTPADDSRRPSAAGGYFETPVSASAVLASLSAQSGFLRRCSAWATIPFLEAR